MRVIQLLVLLSSEIAEPLPAAEPICHNLFLGADASDSSALSDPSNWSNGLPRAGQRTCLPNEYGQGLRVLQVPARHDGSVAGPTGACCIGSMCEELPLDTCYEQGGYPPPNVTNCFPATCAAGACCIDPDSCLDEDATGQPMDEFVCDLQGGTYVGRGDCDSGLPCPYQRLPDGYELIELTGGMQAAYLSSLRINDCGEIVFGMRSAGAPSTEQEIMLYDNGLFRAVTNNAISEGFPKINNDGLIAWQHLGSV